MAPKKVTCGSCEQGIAKADKHVECNACKRKYHEKCSGVTDGELAVLHGKTKLNSEMVALSKGWE